MRLYCDVCTICRPLDDQTQPRIAAESLVFAQILKRIEDGSIQLISSDTLETEVGNNPDQTRRQHSEDILFRAFDFADTTDDVKRIAEQFQKYGIKPMDSFHLASAMKAEADYFVTCDDQLSRKAKLLNTGSMIVMSLLEFLQELTQ